MTSGVEETLINHQNTQKVLSHVLRIESVQQGNEEIALFSYFFLIFQRLLVWEIEIFFYNSDNWLVQIVQSDIRGFLNMIW